MMKPIQGIKAISFDADGTLWDFAKVMRYSLGCVMKELERAEPRAAARLDMEKMIEIRNRVAEELKGKVTNLEEIRYQAFRKTLAEAGRPDDALAAELNRIYLKHRFEDAELFPDVLPALSALRPDFTLGLLSNGNSYPERCGLDGIFRFVVFSQEHGVEKPDPRLFQIALRKAGCSAEQLLHVGDSLENDVAGAANAGIKSVWLNREARPNDLGINVEYEIRSLSELAGLLNEYGKDK
jgi:2-haloalkanoic acid dehalogenase type II